MGDLPDIDPSEVGFIAYWNAIEDGGASEITPTNATADGRVQSYTLYDNGWEGVYNSFEAGEHTVRVKSDGWVIAYMDQSASDDFAFTQQSKSNLTGAYNIAYGGLNPNNHADILNNTLRRAVESLMQEFDQWGDGTITYNASDVGIYDYEWEGTAVTMLSHRESHNDFGGTSSSDTVSFLRTEGTTVHYGVITGGVEGTDNNGDTSGGEVIVEGTKIADHYENSGNIYEERYGSIDLIDRGIFPAAGTELNTTVKAESNGQEGLAAACAVVVWE